MSDDGSQVSVVWEKQYYAKVTEAQEKLRPLGTVELQTQLRLPATAGGTKAWWEEPCGNPDRHAIWKEAHTLFDTRDPSWCVKLVGVDCLRDLQGSRAIVTCHGQWKYGRRMCGVNMWMVTGWLM